MVRGREKEIKRDKRKRDRKRDTHKNFDFL